MNDFLKDKELKNAEDILNAMSVEEAISSFSMIDEYIVKLLECSAEDFLSLNNHFKSYYKDSKKIAENATNILMAITDESLSSSFNNLKDIARDFARVSDIFTTNVENFDIGLKKTIHKIESIKIQNQNLWQNILSLKLLIANTFNNKYIEENTESFNIIDNEIEKIKNVFVELNSNIDNYINKTTEGYLFLTTIKQENYSHLQRLNDKIDVSFELYNKKNKEASHLYTALKEQTDRNAVNIASIITNLQYHDIIRQKIEHIRKIHKDLIEELGVFLEGDSDKAMIHNKIKTYIKIRDISGLQAAQLLHANNQYQNAINEISKNLEAIGNEMMVISSMCDNLVGKSEQSKSHYLNDIIDYLGAALQYNHKLSQLVENIHHQADILSLIVKEINDNYSEITTSNNLIIKILNQIGLSLREEQNKGIVQIFALFKDINNQEVQIKNSLDDLIGQIKELYNLDKELIGEHNLLKSLEELGLKIPDLINLLKKSIHDVDDFLFINSSLSINVSDSIRNSLRNIKYYELFEKSCMMIISELNSINLRLNYGNNITIKSKEENLSHLKERYTMASEHIIHERVAKIENSNEIFNENVNQIIKLADENSFDNDDNIELF